MLWNEVLEDRPYPGKEVAGRVLSPQRIQQVWFAGAHANVGGGYPDDGLAFTALDWMMEEAASLRLRYDPAARLELLARLRQVALTDGVLSAHEGRLLERAAELLGLGAEATERVEPRTGP